MISQETIDTICMDFKRLGAQGNLTRIAELNGVKVCTVRKVLESKGYEVGMRKSPTNQKPPPESEKIIALAGKGLSYEELADVLGISYQAAVGRVRRLGLQAEFDKVGTKTNEERRRRSCEWMRENRRKKMEEELRACGLLKEGEEYVLSGETA